jgi:lysophospholipase L1-like esterase
MRRLGFALAAGVAGFAALLGIELQMARRIEVMDGFPPDEVGGRVGPPGDPLRVAWIGDSTGVGVGCSSAERVLPRAVCVGLARPVELQVLAASGARVSDALVNQSPLLTDLRAQWVFVAIGTNDVIHLTPRARFRAELDLLLRAVEEEKPERIIVLGLGDFGGSLAFAQPLRWIVGARSRRLDADVGEAARRHDVLHVDLVARRGDRFRANPARYHARDGFHPGDEGYGLWADATLEAIREAGW